MEFWQPDKIWEGEDSYVIGGGASLKGFDFERLRGRNLIGCNSSFRLGPELCKFVFFGDQKFFLAYEGELETFVRRGGVVVTNSLGAARKGAPWLKVMRRHPRGLSKDGLGWNWNSGSSAVNLALNFGARRVFLLGFDMTVSRRGETNWYLQNVHRPNERVYPRFIEGFRYVKMDLPQVFPGCEIVNVTDDSRLPWFPVESPSDHFGPKEGVSEEQSNGQNHIQG